MSWKVLSIILYGHTLPNSILLTTEYLTALIARTDYMFCAGFFCTRKNFFIFFQKKKTKLNNKISRQMLAKKAGVSIKTIQRALSEIDDLRFV